MISDNPIRTYLDYAASTPVDPKVVDAMVPYFSETFGNPSSVHAFGQKTDAAVEKARREMAELLNCHPGEIVFTSCGSESDNLAIRGAALSAQRERNTKHILISPVEHHAVSLTGKDLQDNFGFELDFLPVDKYGRVTPKELEKLLRPDTAIVSIMYGNNEIGTINPIQELGAVCRDAGIPFHTDAVQAAAYYPINTQEINADLISIGAHKFYGPKGIGALYIREGLNIQPTLTGGSQENTKRAGTSNVPYIVGMAEAFRLVDEEREESNQKLTKIRDRVIRQILNSIPDSQLTGHPTERLPNHASFVFKGVDGNELLMMLDAQGFACSSGSACKTGDPEPSDVIIALGIEREWALGSLRISFGKMTKDQDVDRFLNILPEVISQNRALGAL